MSNSTNSEKWSARERLLFIDRVTYWRGWIRRSDIVKRFGVSMPQASADLSEYQRLYPRNIKYDPCQKRYLASRSMHSMTGELAGLEEGFEVLRAEAGEKVASCVATIDIPRHYFSVPIARDLVRAAIAKSPLEIYYYSVNSGTERWRGILPTSFANDGYRWHARAWCYDTASYRDFVLGRIAKTRTWDAPIGGIPTDEDWTTWDEIKFRPNRSLSSVQREAIARDFGMRDGLGTLKVRRAMLNYTLRYLGLLEREGSPRLEPVYGASGLRSVRGTSARSATSDVCVRCKA